MYFQGVRFILYSRGMFDCKSSRRIDRRAVQITWLPLQVEPSSSADTRAKFQRNTGRWTERPQWKLFSDVLKVTMIKDDDVSQPDAGFSDWSSYAWAQNRPLWD